MVGRFLLLGVLCTEVSSERERMWAKLMGADQLLVKQDLYDALPRTDSISLTGT